MAKLEWTHNAPNMSGKAMAMIHAAAAPAERPALYLGRFGVLFANSLAGAQLDRMA